MHRAFFMTEILFGDEFTKEYPNFPANLQNAIVDFVTLVGEYGFYRATFHQYKGKISPSWRNLDPTNPNYTYTHTQKLWHYHIGIPVYRLSKTGRYHTSDMVLHFIWDNNKDKITIVDCTEHYCFDGSFWLPAPQYLTIDNNK